MKIKLAAVAVALLAAVPASGQNESDLMPPAPAAPKGGGGYYYPGMPLPAAPEPAGPGPAGARAAPGSKDEKKAASGLDLFDNEFELEPASPSGPVESRPDSVVVKKGDTLWGLSASYLRDPWAWPKLWSYNPTITNPHWIYPGDVIHLGPHGEAPPPPPPSQEPELRKLQTAPLPEALLLKQTGFVEPHELEQAGTIIGSKEEKIMLATLDEAYVEYHPGQPLQAGTRYSIYKPIRTVKHPVTGERLGEMVQIFGELEVRQVTSSRIARTLIIDSHDPIERGYRVGPLKRQYRIPEARPAGVDQVGVVVAQLRDLELIGEQVIVFVDRGSKDGVEVGNRFSIVRRGDGYQPLLWHGGPIDDRRFPREQVGELLVLETRERLSTGLMLRSTREVRVGDRVELHRGN